MSVDERTKSFVLLLTQNERRVYAYILSVIPRWNDADEILQETNLRLWEEFDKYEPGTDFAAWAVRIAHFQVLTHRRRQGRERVQFSQEFIEAVSDDTRAAPEISDERHWALEQCIERLSERDRDLLRRSYARGAQIKQVALEIGRGVEATYKSLGRIRQRLHACIESRLAREEQP